MDFQRIAQPVLKCLHSVGKTTASIAKDCGRYAYKHRETIIGGVGGYVIGRAVESIPFVGPLLKPVASLVLGVCGVGFGYQRELERRRLDDRERGYPS
jgi:hypothetical protein